jgi:tetratricopeptide (TPR) repeat protein
MIEQAINLSPNIPTYYLFKNLIISGAIQNNIALDTFKCPITNTDINNRQCLLETKYQSADNAVNQQPFYWRSVFEKAVSADNLLKYDEALELYEQTSKLIPNSWPLRNQLTDLYISEEKYDKAEIHLNHSLKITQKGSYNVEAQRLREALDDRIQDSW